MVVLLWFAGTAFLTVWLVFRDPAFDYRLVIVGALLPDVVDVAFGGAALLHSVLGSIAPARRRDGGHDRPALAAAPSRSPCPSARSCTWCSTAPSPTSQSFWWPLAGGSLAEHPLPVVGRGWWNLLLELIGLGILVWAWRRFGLAGAARRRLFLREGRLDASLVR